MNDKARVHDTVRSTPIVTASTSTKSVFTIPKLPWPALSLDLNPIEHIKVNLKRRKYSITNYNPTTITELKAAAVEEWNNIPQPDIEYIMDGLPNGLQEVVEVGDY